MRVYDASGDVAQTVMMPEAEINAAKIEMMAADAPWHQRKEIGEGAEEDVIANVRRAQDFFGVHGTQDLVAAVGQLLDQAEERGERRGARAVMALLARVLGDCRTRYGFETEEVT